MKVLNLRCEHDHRFEGWFGSEDDYLSQTERRLIECPMCGAKDISRLPSAPRLNVSGLREPVAATPPASDASELVTTGQAHWLRAVRQMMAQTEDVGERFPEEARRIHYGETAERAIRGKASREEAEALRDEGIEVVSVPLPGGLNGNVQ
jgi:hypothetical protein